MTIQNIERYITVAEKLGRKWITTNLGKPACMITRNVSELKF